MTATLDGIRRHTTTALGIARRFYRKLPKHVPWEDIEQAALVGLWQWKKAHPDEAVEGWLGGLVMRVRGSIADELRRQDWLPRRSAAGQSCRVVAMSDSLSAALRSLEPDPEETLSMKQELAEARRAKLPQQYAEVIDLAYYRGKSFQEIGDSRGLTQARISQIHTDAIQIMRARLQPRERTSTNDQRAAVARMKLEGVGPAEAARRLGISYWVARRLYRQQAPLAKCGAKREEETT